MSIRQTITVVSRATGEELYHSQYLGNNERTKVGNEICMAVGDFSVIKEDNDFFYRNWDTGTIKKKLSSDDKIEDFEICWKPTFKDFFEDLKNYQKEKIEIMEEAGIDPLEDLKDYQIERFLKHSYDGGNLFVETITIVAREIGKYIDYISEEWDEEIEIIITCG